MRHLITVFIIIIVAASTALAEFPEVEGLFGLEPVNATTAFAIWVPLGDGEAIESVTWYSSDGQLVFPGLKAIAGDPGHPELLTEAVTVAADFHGLTLQWSEVPFIQPIASTSEGVYLIFLLPEGSDYSGPGDGGGAGFGYVLAEGAKRCWVTNDGVSWQPLKGVFQIAIDAVMTGDKSGNVLVLSKPGGSNDEQSRGELPPKYEQSMTVVPNPFNPETEIRFTLPTAGKTKISIFDIRGRRIRSLMDESLEAGHHSVRWNGKNENGSGVASGIYFAKLKSTGIEMIVRMALVQ